MKKVKIMGIVNVTPDSFSDGGQFYQPQLAINHAYKLLEEGADIIDIGGQSTRPGFKEVSPEEEIRRIRPILEFLCKENILLSIDTYFPKVADYALSMGVSILNDIRGLDHKGMLDIACKYPHTKLIITHSRNRKEKLTLEKDIQSFYREKYHLCLSYGINKKQLYFDPGIGFNKNFSENIEIIKNLDMFRYDEIPLVLGISRKRVVGQLINEENPLKRDQISALLSLISAIKGVNIIRTHNVKNFKQFYDIYESFTCPT